MHYKEIDAHTLNNKVRQRLGFQNKKQSFFDGILQDNYTDNNEQGFKEGKNWQLNETKHDTQPQALTYYGCPVCYSVQSSLEDAQNCSKLEKQFQTIISTLKVGSVICLRRCNNQEDVVDIFNGRIPELEFARIEGFTYCYSGTYCGELLTAFITYARVPVKRDALSFNNAYINANYLDKYIIEESTEAAWLEYELKTNNE